MRQKKCSAISGLFCRTFFSIIILNLLPTENTHKVTSLLKKENTQVFCILLLFTQSYIFI